MKTRYEEENSDTDSFFSASWIIEDVVFDSKSDKRYLYTISMWEIAGYEIRQKMMTEFNNPFIIAYLQFGLTDLSFPNSTFRALHKKKHKLIKHETLILKLTLKILNSNN